jgi:hypothetical protein
VDELSGGGEERSLTQEDDRTASFRTTGLFAGFGPDDADALLGAGDRLIRVLSQDVVYGRVHATRTVVRRYLMTSSSTPHVSSEGTAKNVEQTLRPRK